MGQYVYVGFVTLLSALVACPVQPPPDTDTDDTQPADTAVERGISCVRLLEYDAESDCQRWVWEDLDPDYWTDWAAHDVCPDVSIYTADNTGRCVYLSQTCDETALDDPWLAGCDVFPQCCEETAGPFRDAPACEDFEVDRCAPV